MTRTRLETNFVRLLNQCKSMANSGKHTEWRFEKFIATLEELLAELQASPMVPEKQILDEYVHSVSFLKGLIVTEKLPSITDKAVASQFLSPCSSFGDSISKEIRHKVAAQYTSQVREELMTTKPVVSNENTLRESKNKEFEDPTSTLRQRKSELLSSVNPKVLPVRDFDAVISNEQQTQETITNDLLALTRTLKDQSISANGIIQKDLVTLEKSNALADENQGNLDTQTQKLRERSGFCTRCWVWLFLVLVCCAFISMVIFMRLFKKKKHS